MIIHDKCMVTGDHEAVLKLHCSYIGLPKLKK